MNDDQRSDALFAVLLYISTHRPRSFVLENVEWLVMGITETFHMLIKALREVQDLDKALGPAYEVHWAIMDTRTHGHMPQRRARV